MKVKLRVFTHEIGVFVLSHMQDGFVYLHMKVRAFTHTVSCIHTATNGNRYDAIRGYEVFWLLNTDSNLN